MVRDRPALHDGPPWKRNTDRTNTSGNDNQSTCFDYSEGCSSHRDGKCKLGGECAFKRTENVRSKPRKRCNCVVVAKTLDYTQAEDKNTSLKFFAKGDFLHRVSALPFFIKKKWGEDCQEVLTGSGRRTICERAREARSNLGNYLTRWTKRSKSECSVVRATRKLCRIYRSKHGFCSQESAQEHV